MVEYIWVSDKIENKIRNLVGLRKITIASAFMSLYGLQALEDVVAKNMLKKHSVDVYLSKEFSNTGSGEILKRLQRISNVYIMTKKKLHAKVYYFVGSTSLLITGSSNFTKGGIAENFEFNIQTDEIQESRIDAFFERCHDLATIVTDSIVKHYIDTEDDRRELAKTQHKINKRLDFEATSDLFDEDRYNLDGYYFNFADYETLFPKNQESNTKEIDKRRRIIQGKILTLDELISRELKKNYLSHHWMPAHITSTIRPMEFNENRISWVGVRYARTRTVESIRELKLSGDGFGFPKYACIQFCIIAEGFSINLFHAVKRDAVDRDYLRSQIKNSEYASKLVKTINDLKQNGFVWHLEDIDSFDFDSRNANDFIEFIEQDREGHTSFLEYWVDPDDMRLFDADSICNLVVEKTRILTPLLDLVSSGWKKTRENNLTT